MNLEPIVLIWNLVALAGTCYALDALATANADYDLVVERRGDNADKRRLHRLECEIAKGDVISARWIVVQECAFLATGLLAISQAPDSHRSTLGWIIVTLLVIGAAVLPFRLAGQRRRRRRLVRPDA